MKKNLEKYIKLIQILPQEQVLFVGRKHFLFYMLELLIPIIFLTTALVLIFYIKYQIAWYVGGGLFLFSMLGFYKIRVDYHYDIIIVTNRRVVCRNSHLIGHTETNLEYESITAVRPDQKGLMPFLFGYGNIIIETKSAALGNICFKNMRKHKEIAHTIATYMDKFGLSNK
jgi:hypothetical protein